MTRLHELTRVMRSKNAGPFLVTVDAFFLDRDAYERARASGAFTPERVAALYGRGTDDVRGVHWDPESLGLKVTLLKRPSANQPGCADVFGAHQHLPIAYAEV